LNGKEQKNNLQKILTSILDPVKLDTNFHSVNILIMEDGIIFCFHPQNSNNAYAFVNQLSKIVEKIKTMQLVSTVCRNTFVRIY